MPPAMKAVKEGLSMTAGGLMCWIVPTALSFPLHRKTNKQTTNTNVIATVIKYQ
jgi:hypothetical protein